MVRGSARVQLLDNICEGQALVHLHVLDLVEDCFEVFIEQRIHDLLNVLGQRAARALVHAVLTDLI